MVMDAPNSSPRIPLHRPVMLAQVLELLHPEKGDRALDLTVGTGGHALAIGQRLGARGLLVGLDADGQVLSVAAERLATAGACPFRLFQRRFSRAPELLACLGVEGFDVVLADLGVGPQLDDPSRGFAFDSEARLDMRYDTSSGTTAWEVVNRMPERRLAEILYRLGEERYSRQIAAAICCQRSKAPIETPAQLSALIKRVAARRSRGRTWRIHPATRSMMAIRAYVNDELGELDRLLDVLPCLLATDGRAAILTYQSLEARRVKQTWRSQQDQGLIEILTKHPIKPTEQEVRDNPRARSAQLRGCRKARKGRTCT